MILRWYGSSLSLFSATRASYASIGVRCLVLRNLAEEAHTRSNPKRRDAIMLRIYKVQKLMLGNGAEPGLFGCEGLLGYLDPVFSIISERIYPGIFTPYFAHRPHFARPMAFTTMVIANLLWHNYHYRTLFNFVFY